MKILKLPILVLALCIIFACKDDIPLEPILSNPPTYGTQIELLKIEDVLNGKDFELKKLLNRVRGSVGKRASGSKVIWSRKNDFSIGLYICAHHVVGVDAFNTRNELHLNLLGTNNYWGVFGKSQIAPTNGDLDFGNTLIADFFLYQPAISSNATNTTINPMDDFYIGIVDNQRIQDNGFGISPEKVQTNVALDMYDPDERTLVSETWASPVAGENAIAIGYPHDTDQFPNGAVAYGNILSDTEAEAMIEELKSFNDSEGNIPYNSQVEFFLKIQGINGMSGGGVFNNKGQLLGTMIRASDADGAPRIVRVVRVSYIKEKFTKYYNTLSKSEKNTIYPFVSGEL